MDFGRPDATQSELCRWLAAHFGTPSPQRVIEAILEAETARGLLEDAQQAQHSLVASLRQQNRQLTEQLTRMQRELESAVSTAHARTLSTVERRLLHTLQTSLAASPATVRGLLATEDSVARLEAIVRCVAEASAALFTELQSLEDQLDAYQHGPGNGKDLSDELVRAQEELSALRRALQTEERRSEALEARATTMEADYAILQAKMASRSLDVDVISVGTDACDPFLDQQVEAERVDAWIQSELTSGDYDLLYRRCEELQNSVCRVQKDLADARREVLARAEQPVDDVPEATDASIQVAYEPELVDCGIDAPDSEPSIREEEEEEEETKEVPHTFDLAVSKITLEMEVQTENVLVLDVEMQTDDLIDLETEGLVIEGVPPSLTRKLCQFISLLESTDTSVDESTIREEARRLRTCLGREEPDPGASCACQTESQPALYAPDPSCPDFAEQMLQFQTTLQNLYTTVTQNQTTANRDINLEDLAVTLRDQLLESLSNPQPTQLKAVPQAVDFTVITEDVRNCDKTMQSLSKKRGYGGRSPKSLLSFWK